MRRPDTSKQRVWLGTSQYRSGCRNAATNAAATNAYAYSDGDAMRAWNTYAYSDSNGNSNSNSNSNSNGYSYGYGDTYTDFNSAAYPDSQRYSPIEASSDSASPAVSAWFPACPQQLCAKVGDWGEVRSE